MHAVFLTQCNPGFDSSQVSHLWNRKPLWTHLCRNNHGCTKLYMARQCGPRLVLHESFRGVSTYTWDRLKERFWFWEKMLIMHEAPLCITGNGVVQGMQSSNAPRHISKHQQGTLFHIQPSYCLFLLCSAYGTRLVPNCHQTDAHFVWLIDDGVHGHVCGDSHQASLHNMTMTALSVDFKGAMVLEEYCISRGSLLKNWISCQQVSSEHRFWNSLCGLLTMMIHAWRFFVPECFQVCVYVMFKIALWSN